MKITHVTSAHSRESVRIFHKMASSSISYGHQVCIVVADGKKNDIKNGITFYDVGIFKNRYLRFFLSSLRVVLKAKSMKSDVSHLHDPDLGYGRYYCSVGVKGSFLMLMKIIRYKFFTKLI